MKRIKVGIISPNDKRPWCVLANTDSVLKKEGELAEILKQRNFEVVRNGKETVWKTSLARAQTKYLLENGAAVILIHQGDWTFPTRTLEIFTEVKRLAEGRTPNIIMFSCQDSKVPGLVAGMAAKGSLLRIGQNIDHVFGKPNDKEIQKQLVEILKRNSDSSYERNAKLREKGWGLDEKNPEFIKRVGEAGNWAKLLAAKVLPQEKYLALGGMSLDMTTTTADIDQWRMLFGISYAHLDQIWIDKKADRLLSKKDPRIEKALNDILAKHNLSFAKDKKRIERKIILQLASYYAISDLMVEEEATFGGIKCQDEESALRCTQCIAAAYLNNNTEPTGEGKVIMPFACENDMDSALTQLLLSRINHKPAGFGDFRDVEYDDKFEDKRARLLIVNCGQHPPYYFEQAPEHLEQEHFYAGGGASVRGRTPAGKILTIARLGRIELKYILVATVMETEKAELIDHEKYNLSWPIIRGKLPRNLSGKKMIDIWPCNHLGFIEDDVTAELLALAEEFKIGYRIIDSDGFEHYKNPLNP